jgi:hypothetical protein
LEKLGEKLGKIWKKLAKQGRKFGFAWAHKSLLPPAGEGGGEAAG